jgi:hypothetical protein
MKTCTAASSSADRDNWKQCQNECRMQGDEQVWHQQVLVSERDASLARHVYRRFVATVMAVCAG